MEENKRKNQKKKNHFIPQVYQRFFSCNKDEKTIDCFNLNLNKCIKGVAISSQMQKDYFYGDDGVIEDELDRKYERNYKEIIADLLCKVMGPSEQVQNLVMLMHFRTKSQRDRSIKAREIMIDAHSKAFAYDFLRYLKNRLPEVNATIEDVLPMVIDSMKDEYLEEKYVVMQNYETFKTHASIINDLSYKVLKNDTQVNFFTSDTPVVIYNPFLGSKVSGLGTNGLGQIGLVLIMPLSPLHLLIFYDKKIYKLGAKKQKVFKLSLLSDVNNLNFFQIVNAQTNIYSNNFKLSEIKLICKLAKRRRAWKHNLEFSGPYQTFYSESPVPIVKLSFLKILKKTRKYELQFPFLR